MWLSVGVGVAGLLVSLVMWSKVPSPMPIHWDAAGQANGFAPKAVGLTLLPLTTFGLTALLAVIGRSLTDKVEAARVMGVTSVLVSLFMLALHGLMISAALRPDYALSMGWMMALMGALFAALGAMMPGIEQNKWIGVRTPWTMADETNWALTHRFAGFSMVAGGVVAMLVSALPLAPTALFVIAFSAVMLGALAPVVASYAIHKIRS